MTLRLDDCREILGRIDPSICGTLEAGFQEATRVMSPGGLQNYLDGAQTLAHLGRGAELVISFLQQTPLAVKEVGDEIIPDLITSVMKLSSMVGGGVIVALFDSLPTAANRLGDADLLRQYLGLIHQLSAKAPRGIRPMLQHLDPLLEKLTLGGLRRWALWGAQAHSRNPETLQKYFALETSDSHAMLQQERRGTLFVDTQRKLNFYLRALWGRDFYMRPTSGDYESREGFRPFIEFPIIYLPDAFDDIRVRCRFTGVERCISGKELYRAAGAHAAAHLVYARNPISAEQLTPVQMLLIGLFEDARIEELAIRDFPGLRSLWLQFHGATDDEAEEDAGLALVDRLAHTLLGGTRQTGDELIDATTAAFRRALEADPWDNRLSWNLGVTFFNEIAQRVPLRVLRTQTTIRIPYRDDNRVIWRYAGDPWLDAERIIPVPKQVRRKVSLMEMLDEVDCELAGDDAQEVWTLETPFYLDQEGCTINELEGKEPVSDPFHYPEWDYQVQWHRPNWVTVLEKRQPAGEPALMDRILSDHQPVASRLKLLVDALQPRGLIRQRRQEDGEEIDLDAAVRAIIDLRRGHVPDPRITIRYLRKSRDLAVLVLLDLSESTNEILPGSDRTVLQLAREATALLAWAIAGIGDPFAVHGFASNGRHDVQYYRFKDFDQAYDDSAKSRLAGMTGGLSTRMGAALRHAGGFLMKRPQRKKLLLLVTDGEPADIDERDPQYLRFDARKAVEEVAARGVTTYCLTLDTHADDYVSRIFGANRYTVLDQVQKLPEKLPGLFLALTS